MAMCRLLDNQRLSIAFQGECGRLPGYMRRHVIPRCGRCFCLVWFPCLRLCAGGPKNNNNKSAKSNLGRGPHRGAVAHVRRKIPIGYNGAPQIRPENTPSRGPISEPHYTCLIPGPVRPMMPNSIRIRFAVFPQCTGQIDGRTHVRKYGPTDRPRESLTTIGGLGRCATRATLPNNNNNNKNNNNS